MYFVGVAIIILTLITLVTSIGITAILLFNARIVFLLDPIDSLVILPPENTYYIVVNYIIPIIYTVPLITLFIAYIIARNGRFFEMFVRFIWNVNKHNLYIKNIYLDKLIGLPRSCKQKQAIIFMLCQQKFIKDNIQLPPNEITKKIAQYILI